MIVASTGRFCVTCVCPADDRGHVATAGLLVSHELDLGSFHHRIGRFDHADEAFDFDHSECVSHDSIAPYLSTNFSGSLPVTPLSAAVAAAAAASISAS